MGVQREGTAVLMLRKVVEAFADSCLMPLCVLKGEELTIIPSEFMLKIVQVLTPSLFTLLSTQSRVLVTASTF